MSRHSPGLETNLGHVPSAGGLAGSGRHVVARRRPKLGPPGAGPASPRLFPELRPQALMFLLL